MRHSRFGAVGEPQSPLGIVCISNDRNPILRGEKQVRERLTCGKRCDEELLGIRPPRITCGNSGQMTSEA